MYTSCHKNFKTDLYVTYSISGNRGVDAGYTGRCYPALAPKKGFWKIWHDNIGKISEEENNRYYIREYYKEVLSKMDPEDVLREIHTDSVLLCYEDPSEFCHRHIVAAWFHILLGIDVPEVKIENGRMVEVSRPEYIEEELETIMRDSVNMKGFTSLRALYLFNKGNELDQKADMLYQEGRINIAHDYRQAACFFRCDADEVEQEYKASKRIREKK